MNCPHCQKRLPIDWAVNTCYFCGERLTGPDGEYLRPKGGDFSAGLFPIGAFFLCLLGPPAATLLATVLFRSRDFDSFPPVIGLFGGAGGGIACGVMLGLRFSPHSWVRAPLCLFLVALMVVVCLLLCMGGCAVGGFSPDMSGL